MTIEGKNPVKEAISGQVTIEKIYLQKGTERSSGNIVALAKEHKIPLHYADKAVLDKMSRTGGRHQGVIAVASEFVYSDLEVILARAKEKGKPLFILILDGITDPNNLGGIIRSAECAGVDGIVIPSRRAAGVTETVIKVSAGATQHVLIHKAVNVNDVIRRLKDMNVYVYAADMKGKPMYSVNLKGDVAIVIGSEGEGVKRLTLELSDDVISIPQMGKINSLNASVAAGIVLFEKIRQENF